MAQHKNKGNISGIKTTVATVTVAAVAVLCLLAACDRSTLVHTYAHVDGAVWRHADTLLIESELLDSGRVGRMYIDVRSDSRYPYANLGISIEGMGPDSTPVFPQKEVDVQLIDGQGGSNDGSGREAIRTVEVLIDTLRMEKSGMYRFRIAQSMTDSVLNGIRDVGIRIESFSATDLE